VAAPRRAIYKENCEDPFGLAGFFPPRPRLSDRELSGWWRDESPGDDSEESKEITNDGGDTLGFQHTLFSTREEQPVETIIEHDVKSGVLSICAQFLLFTTCNPWHLRVVTGKWPNWEDETIEDHLHSPYTSDETCDDEAVRLAYERRRCGSYGQQWDGDYDKQAPERASKLFYGAGEEEEGAGSSWFGLVR